MKRYLTLDEVLALHRLALDSTGGAEGVRDLGALESAVAQPYMAFGGADLYPTIVEQEQTVLAVAAGSLKRDGFTEWVRSRLKERSRSEPNDTVAG